MLFCNYIPPVHSVQQLYEAGGIVCSPKGLQYGSFNAQILSAIVKHGIKTDIPNIEGAQADDILGLSICGGAVRFLFEGRLYFMRERAYTEISKLVFDSCQENPQKHQVSSGPVGDVINTTVDAYNLAVCN